MWCYRVSTDVSGLIHSLTSFSDLADAFPAGDFREYFRHEFLTAMARETRANVDFSPHTRDTGRWAREQIKRQVGTSLGNNPYLRPAPL
jgi:importin subunit beta-1